MTDTKSAIFKGYISELETYIPAIKEHFYALYTSTDDGNALDEVLRLVHSIRGASALVGESTMCRAAQQMEDELEQCLKATLEFSPAIYTDGMDFVDILVDFCKEARAGEGISVPLDRRVDNFCNTVMARLSETSAGAEDTVPDLDISPAFLEESLAEDEAFIDSLLDELSSTGLQSPEDTAEVGASDNISVLGGDDEQPEDGDLEILRREIARLENDFLLENDTKIEKECGNEVQKVKNTIVTSSVSTSFFSDEEQQFLLEGFLEEADEHMEEIYSSLQRLETSENLNNSHHQEDVRVIRRAVHTIKGAAAVVGLQAVADYGHTFEDFLDWLYEGHRTLNRQIIQTLAKAMDLLNQIIEKPEDVSEEDKEEVYHKFSLLYEAADVAKEEAEIADDSGNSVSFGEDDLEEKMDISQASSSANSMSMLSAEEQQFIKEGFFEEASEHMQEIYTVLQQLDKIEDFTGEQYDEEIKTIRRSVHTIKGAAAAVGLQNIADYGHKFEDFLDWLYEGKRRLSRDIFIVLASAVDLLSRIVDDSDAKYEQEQKELKQLFSALYAQNYSETQDVDGSDLQDLDIEVTEQQTLSRDERVEEILDDESELQENGSTQKEKSGSVANDLSTDDLSESLLENVVHAMQDDAFGDGSSSHVMETRSSMRQKGRTLRINQARFDRLMKLVNDLLVGVSGFDSDMKLFASAVEDLGVASQRLKTIAQDLEKNYEVKALEQISHQLSRIDELQSRVQQSTLLSEFDSMELDQYSNLHLIIRSLNESSVDFQTFHDSFGRIYDEIDGDINRQYQITRELQIQLMRARLMPLSALTPRLSRTVREVSSVLGKSVRLVMDGEWTELDRLLWEKLADPLMHLLRNAIHHGIESEEQRVAAGKPSVATVRISGSREGNQVYIRCSDDGRGLDFDAIKKRAEELHIVEDADTLTEEQLTELVFNAGFSTKSISEISGRGVGLDVVRQNVRELQGEVRVQSVAGERTTFIIRIPLTMGVVRILQLQIGGAVYGIAMEDVKMVQRVTASQVDMRKGIVSLNNKDVPWFSLARLLGDVEEDSDDPHSYLAVLAEYQNQLVGISIPEVIAQREVIIKELGGLLQGLPFVSGAAVLGDGVIIPVLNLQGLIAKATSSKIGTAVRVKEVEAVEEDRTFKVMVVDDSISIRRILGRMIRPRGWQVLEAKDGQYALELLEDERPDCILLDIEMPRLNGFEFLTIKSNIDEYKNIPVVMLTSRSSEKHKKKALELGAAAFLNKPSNEKELVETILYVLPRKTKDEMLSFEMAANDG